jgi:hypothetical protein
MSGDWPFADDWLVERDDSKHLCRQKSFRKETGASAGDVLQPIVDLLRVPIR